MSRVRVLAAASLAALVACSGGGGPAPLDPDAAIDDAAIDDAATDDAAIDAIPDAPTPDAPADAAAIDATDAPTVDAPTDGAPMDTVSWQGQIVVRVNDLTGYDTFVTDANRRVLFVAPDGSVVDTVTDAAGIAIGPGIPDTTVFVTRYHTYLHVFTAVQPGTIIDLKLPPWLRFSSYQPIGLRRFQLSPTAAGTYDVVASTCTSGPRGAATPGPVAIEPRTDCPHLQDAMVVGYRTSSTGVTGWGVLDPVDLPAAAGTAVIPLVPPPQVDVHYTSIPALGRLAPAIFIRGRDLAISLGGPQVPPGGPTADVAIRTIPVGTAVLHTALIMPFTPDVPSWNLLSYDEPLAGASAAIDLGDPIAGLVNVRLGPGSSVRWDWTGNVAHKGDVAHARLHYQRADTSIGTAHLYGPGDRDGIVLPPWPAAIAHLAPAGWIEVGPPTIYDPLDRAGYAASLRDVYFDRLGLAPYAADPPYPHERVWTARYQPSQPESAP